MPNLGLSSNLILGPLGWIVIMRRLPSIEIRWEGFRLKTDDIGTRNLIRWAGLKEMNILLINFVIYLQSEIKNICVVSFFGCYNNKNFGNVTGKREISAQQRSLSHENKVLAVRCELHSFCMHRWHQKSGEYLNEKPEAGINSKKMYKSEIYNNNNINIQKKFPDESGYALLCFF